jgi:site-specific DNA recombinase
MEKNAVIYARVGSSEQAKGYSIKNQIEQLELFLKRKGYSKFKVYVDEGYSGRNFNRPGIRDLINDLESFEAIAITQIDRLSRKNSDVISLIDNHLRPLNKKLLISTCDIDSSTLNGYLFISLLCTFKEYERQNISERMKIRANLGKWNGRVMLGYDLIEGRLVINQRESMIVREIFQFRSAEESYKSITDQLNTKGYYTKTGNRFSINSTKTILENPVYAGLIRYSQTSDNNKYRSNYQLVAGQHTAIIDRELWERVQSISKMQRISNGA